jgi:hypothetical protein
MTTKSKIKKTPTAIKTWANSIAVNDNDMVYLRKKNGIMYVMKVEPHLSGIWEKLDPTDIPVISDIHGAKLEDRVADFVANPEIEEKNIRPIPNIPLGWYQDSQANLYKYEGMGVWDSTELSTWSKLLNMVESGTLEFIG